MASVDRTAYPRLKNNISQKELKDKYTLHLHEICQAHSAARGEPAVIAYFTFLKCFQNLGYFPAIDEISDIIVKNIKKHHNIEHPSNNIEYKSKKTIYIHHKHIKASLNKEE